MFLVRKWKDLMTKISPGLDGKKLQEEMDAYNMAYYTSFYKANASQATLLNNDYNYKFQNMANEEELDKLTFTKPTKLKQMADQNIADQLSELFQFIEKNGDYSPYPPSTEYQYDLSHLEAKTQKGEREVIFFPINKDILKRWESFEYKPGTPIKYPGGFSLQIRKSNIDHPDSGYGVFVEGRIMPGTVLAIYPGTLYFPSQLTQEIVKGNEYMISRYDNTVIDGRRWEAIAQKHQKLTAVEEYSGVDVSSNIKALKRFRNPYAIGNYINHPPAGAQANVLNFGYEFVESPTHPRSLPEHLWPYIPHEKTKEPFYYKSFNVHMRSMIIVASEWIKDEELFMNYRFNPRHKLPDWYTDPDPEMSKRRWTGNPLINL